MRNTLCGVAVLAALMPAAAFAGGFDTPVLYSARHMGMGGTGVSWVADPTALFMNPAGLGHTDFIDLHLDVSPIIAQIDASPVILGFPGTQATAGPAVLVPFLFGASFRVWEYITLGIGAYPVASASGGYEYVAKRKPEDEGVSVKDSTTIRFIEISPGIAFNYKDIVRLGIGYRMTLGQLARFQEQVGATAANFDMDTSGWSFDGFRVGFQAKADFLSVGASYRHRIDIDAKDDSGRIVGEANDIVFPLVLPSRLSFGTRGDIPLPDGFTLGLSLDAEFAWQSQNDTSKVAFKDDEGKPGELNSYFKWTDAWTVRAGTELDIPDTALDGNWQARLGFIFDEKTSNINYSSAFGTPPANTYSITAGGGFKSEHWEVNLAYAFRTGSVEVTEENVSEEGGRLESCLTCSGPGNHEITLHGIYADFTWYFDPPASLAHWSPTAGN